MRSEKNKDFKKKQHFKCLVIVLSLVLIAFFYTEQVKAQVDFFVEVVALTPNIKTGSEGNENYFVVTEVQQLAQWAITYLVFNQSGVDYLKDFTIENHFGLELEVISYQTSYSVNTKPGSLSIKRLEQAGEHYLTWDNFDLGPQEWAQLEIVIQTAINSSGKREYVVAGNYDLNSVLKLKYKPQLGGMLTIDQNGYNVVVKETPYLYLNLSGTQFDWYLRFPGQFHAETLVGVVNSNYTVQLAFSDFSDLVEIQGNGTLPVYYALRNSNEELVWLSPEELNTTWLIFDPDAGSGSVSIWQMIDYKDQNKPGIYKNEGVLYFTIVNIEDRYHN